MSHLESTEELELDCIDLSAPLTCFEGRESKLDLELGPLRDGDAPAPASASFFFARDGSGGDVEVAPEVFLFL